MTTDTLADLRLDLRDLAGVVFVATVPDADRLRVQVVVDDPAVVAAVEGRVRELSRRHLDTAVDLEVSATGMRRSELALAGELRAVRGVRSVDLVRGQRGELLRAVVATGSPLATAQVVDLFDRRLGPEVRRRRAQVHERAGDGA
ncbi:MAG: hypothetical protein KY461_15000 [Actinobacteria bacterium]|nr:hypothetical protein [Actinomycetota bacterium]